MLNDLAKGLSVLGNKSASENNLGLPSHVSLTHKIIEMEEK